MRHAGPYLRRFRIAHHSPIGIRQCRGGRKVSPAHRRRSRGRRGPVREVARPDLRPRCLVWIPDPRATRHRRRGRDLHHDLKHGVWIHGDGPERGIRDTVARANLPGIVEADRQLAVVDSVRDPLRECHLVRSDRSAILAEHFDDRDRCGVRSANVARIDPRLPRRRLDPYTVLRERLRRSARHRPRRIAGKFDRRPRTVALPACVASSASRREVARAGPARDRRNNG